MAIFTIQAPDGRKIKIEAADEATAVRGAQEWSAANPVETQQPSEAYTQSMDRASQASQMFQGAVPPRNAERAPGRPDLLGATATTLAGINTVPIVGPALQMTSDAIMGAGSALTGGDYGETVRGLQDRRAELAQANPVANLAGSVAANLGAFGVAGAPRAVASGLSPAAQTLAGGQSIGSTALGLSGSTGAKMGASLASTAGLLTADGIVRGESPTEALTNAVGPSLVSGAIPGATELIKRGGSAVYDGLVRPIQTAFNRENEVVSRIGRALEQGRGNPAAPILSQADEAVARDASIPIVNADRGGAPLRTLARTAANVSPEASASLNATTSNRFETQGPRAVNFIQRLMGGATDDLALQERLRLTARQTNDPAYRAAYDSQQARAIWTPEIRNLMQAGPFRAAINAAEDTATNAAAVGGGRAVRNPFEFMPDGNVTLRTNPDGSRALPNLEFWDIVQRNLRNSADVADRGGDRLLASQIRQMRTQLNNTLDTAVPQFGEARRGAAQFFGAEDAIDAGKTFANAPRSVPEARQAINRFSQPERDAFAIGYSSELIDTIKASRDRVNVINQVFGSQARRELNELALGPQRARELEAYVRVEGIVDALRNAVGGNSSTAQQLIASGVVGGAGGYFASGGNWNGAITGASLLAAGRRGMQMMGKSVDERVMARIGEVLASDDPRLIERAVQNAALSAEHRLALEAIQRGLEAAAKGATIGSAMSMAN